MSKLYVDEILPKDNAKIQAEDLQLPAGSVVQVQPFETNVSVTVSEPDASSYTEYASTTFTPKYTSSEIYIEGILISRHVSASIYRLVTGIFVNGVSITTGDKHFRVYTSGTVSDTDILTHPISFRLPPESLSSGSNTIQFMISDGTGSSTTYNVLYLTSKIMEVAQ